MGKKPQKKGILDILMQEDYDPDGIIRDLRNGHWETVVNLKKYLEKKARRKLDFTEIPGFIEAFRKRYVALLKQDAIEAAKDFLQKLGEEIDVSEETIKALIYCMEKNHVDTFCKILKEKLIKKSEIDEAIKEGVADQTRKLMTRLFEFVNQCGIPISPDHIQKGVSSGSRGWKKSVG